MKELQDKIVAAFGGMVASGKLDEMIGTKLDKCIDEILSDTLRSYSDFGKALREGIGASLQVNVEELGLSGYNTVVAGMIKAKIETSIAGTWRAQLETEIDEMLRAAPESIKMSEIIKRIQDDHEDDARDETWEYMSVHLKVSEYSTGLQFIDVDPQPDKSDYDCQWQMVVDEEGNLSNVRVRGVKPSEVLMGKLRGFELLLFQLRAGNTIIEVDIEHGEEFYYDRCD